MKPYAFEALLRVHPEMGFKGNIEELIKAAEETGQMSKLGKWIFDEAIDQFRTLIGQVAGNDLQISINLSPAQLTPEFVTHAIATARRYPEISGRVILEVTETAALVDFDNARKHLQELREHGFRIAVDDFGTGYSSLSLISRMPIDILKLDQNFATDFQHAVAQSNHAVDGQTALVRCIVTLAKELGVQLIAEGLENTNVVSHFRDLGVLFGQGYIFSRPMPNDQVRDWMDYFRGENEKDPVERLLAAG
jgi:EAL domain-containing protein (putative c-di-GMP-specific phosphodiesterase class I)